MTLSQWNIDQGVQWSKVVAVDEGGHTIAKPCINACGGCYEWFKAYVQVLTSWDDYCKRYHHDAAYRMMIDGAVHVASGHAEAHWDQREVATVKSSRGELLRSSIVLNERELMVACNCTYLPKAVLNGPSLMLPKEHGVGLEQCFLFRNPDRPFREYVETVGSSETSTAVMMPSRGDVWSGKSPALIEKYRQARREESGAHCFLQERTAPLPLLTAFISRVVGSEGEDNGDASDGNNTECEPEEDGISQSLACILDGAASEQPPPKQPLVKTGSSNTILFLSPVKTTENSLLSQSPPSRRRHLTKTPAHAADIAHQNLSDDVDTPDVLDDPESPTCDPNAEGTTSVVRQGFPIRFRPSWDCLLCI